MYRYELVDDSDWQAAQKWFAEPRQTVTRNKYDVARQVILNGHPLKGSSWKGIRWGQVKINLCPNGVVLCYRQKRRSVPYHALVYDPEAPTLLGAYIKRLLEGTMKMKGEDTCQTTLD